MPFHVRTLATFLTLLSLACGRSHLVDDELFAPREMAVMDAGVDAVDAATEPDVPYPVREGCPAHVRLEGRDASVPVDAIWVVAGGGDFLTAFRAATERYWATLLAGNIDTMNVLIVPNEDALPGPEAAFAGRVRYVVGGFRPGVALTSSFEYYSSVLRPDSRRHVVMVSSTNTRYTPAELHRTLKEQLGDDYVLHAIVSEQLDPTVDNPLGVCTNSMGSAARGDVVFTELAERTGGTVSSICAEDWNALIDRLSERIAIRIPIPCAFTLPIIRPPGIRRYDPMGIRLNSHVGDVTELLRNVEDERQCFAGDWWLYAGSDRIHLCPETCTRLEEQRATLDVELDCGY